MAATIILILTLLLLGLFWYQSAKIHELAVNATKKFCKENELQFLDDTVALKKIRLAKSYDSRFCFQRTYRIQYFDPAEQARQTASVLMNGHQCIGVTLDALPKKLATKIINLTDYHKRNDN